MFELIAAKSLIITLLSFPPSRAQSNSSCCEMRTVAGDTGKSGTYSLKDGNDPRCQDGCLYSKDNLDVCFRPNVEYISTCESSTTINTEITSTTTTTTTTTTPSTTTTVSHVEIWRMNQTLFSPPTIAETGDWGPDEFCPDGAYAAGFQLYVAPMCTRRCQTDDDVALMGVKLYCADYHDPVTIIQEITSSVMSPCVRKRGYSCDWEEIFTCPQGQFTKKSRYLSEYFHEHTDEEEGATFEEECPVGTICRNATIIASDPMGGLNLDMGCTDGTEISGDGIMPEEVPLINGEVTTEWSPWLECPTGYAICGIRSKVHQGETDRTSNMGQTEVLFHCCQLPPGFTG